MLTCWRFSEARHLVIESYSWSLHIELLATTASSLRHLSDYHPCFTHKVAISEKFSHFLQGHTHTQEWQHLVLELKSVRAQAPAFPPHPAPRPHLTPQCLGSTHLTLRRLTPSPQSLRSLGSRGKNSPIFQALSLPPRVWVSPLPS